MKLIPFSKYSNCGNNFVILDEISKSSLSEQEKQLFSIKARDVFFGIGSDGLLVVQSLTLDVIRKINDTFGYWTTLPATDGSGDFIFRLFESKGIEAFSCGNGLLCIAQYLYQYHGIEKSRIMTEAPTAQPKIISIGFNDKKKKSWCNIGWPRRAPNNVVSLNRLESNQGEFGEFDVIKELKIIFRKHDLHPFSDLTTLLLDGYITYTGEPHLVIFPDKWLPPEIVNTMFFPIGADGKEKRRNFGSWLVSHIGSSINKNHQNIFPSGVNVSFVRVNSDSEIIQYRCYERNIYRETLACGTGALAIAYIVKQLQLLPNDKLILFPHRCNWYQPGNHQEVELTNEGWILQGQPLRLFTGQLFFNSEGTDIDNQHSVPWGMLNEKSYART